MKTAPEKYEAQLRTLLKNLTQTADQQRAFLIEKITADNGTATDALDNAADAAFFIRIGRYADELRTQIDRHADEDSMFRTALLYVQTLQSVGEFQHSSPPTGDALAHARWLARRQFIEMVRAIA